MSYADRIAERKAWKARSMGFKWQWWRMWLNRVVRRGRNR